MANCQYWYDGQWRSEEEFKKILNSGWIDKLIQEGKVNIPGLEADAARLKQFEKIGAKKAPITLRIRHKAQTRINNARTPDGQFENRNPLDVRKEAIDQGAKPFEFLLAIRVGNEIQTGPGKNNAKLKEELDRSPVDIKSHLKEGVPYMLVPSAYGLYPIQLKSHAIKDTKVSTRLPVLLSMLNKAKTNQEINSARKAIEKLLYRTTIEIVGDKIVITKFDTKTQKNLVYSYSTQQEAIDFLNDQLLRVDYTKINTGTYNTDMANNGAITTDLYADNGSFFNSSSFVLEAYQMSENDKELLDKVFDFGPLSAAEVAARNSVQNTTPAGASSQSKKNEGPVFGTSVPIAPGEQVIIRDVKVPSIENTNYTAVRVIAKVINGELTVVSTQNIQKQKRPQGNDIVIIGTDAKDITRNEALQKFFEDKSIVAFKEKLATEKAATELVEGKKEEQAAPTGIIGRAIAGLSVEETVQEGTEQIAPDLAEQTLDEVIAQADEFVPEEPSNSTEITGGLWSDDDINFDGEFDRDETNTPFRLAPKEDAITWNQEEELNWLKDKIGKAYKRGSGKKGTVKIFHSLEALENYLPKETYQQLLEARKHGKELHGVFMQAAVYLSKTALPGTTYHEAFHIVFNLALPLKVRIELINEAYEKFKDELPLTQITKKDGTIGYRMPTFLEVEELLADKFMEYTIAENNKENTLWDFRKEVDKSVATPADIIVEGVQLGAKLSKEFRGMYRMLKVFFRPGARINIDRIFEDINLGIYKHSIKFKDTRMPEGIRFMQTTAPDRKYDNPIEEIHAFTYLETLMDEIIQQYRDKFDPSMAWNEKEVISKIGVHKLYSAMLSRLAAELRYNHSKGNTERAQRLHKLYMILSDNERGIKKATIEIKDEEGKVTGTKTILQFTKATDLLSRFNQNLIKRGLNISYSGVKTTKETAKETEEEPTFDGYESEEDVFEEAWMKGHIEINPMESVSQRIKSFFATIPKHKSNRANAAKVINSFGVVEKEDPAVVFKYLISKIGNSYSMNDMMEKLQALEKQKPYIKYILERLAIDPILKTELWASVASKNYATFSFVYEVDGGYRVLNSNRKTLDKVITEELIAGFLSHSNPLLEDDLETIKTDKAATLKKGLEAILGFFKKGTDQTGQQISKDTIEEALGKVAKELQKHGFNLSQEDLITIWNPESGKPSFNNIIKLIETFVSITAELEKGNNIFAYQRPTEDLVTKETRKERTLVEKLARQLLPALEKEIISSFRNIDNKTVYNLILSGFLDKQLSKLQDPEKIQEYMKEIAGDPLMSQLPILKDLLETDSDFQDNFKAVLLDGLTRKGKKRAVGYSDMSDIEMEATSMAMFFNGGSPSKAFFKLPIPSDSPTIAYIQGTKYSREEIVEKLVDTARAEFNRIKTLKESSENSPLRRIPNYFSKGTQFQILSFLNGKLNTKKGFDEAAARAAINEFLNYDISKSAFFKKEIAKMKKLDIVKAVNETTGDIVFTEKLIDKSIKDKTAFFKDYLINTYYMNTQLTTLFGGDPAFYKNTVDYQKRYKQVLSPGMFSNSEVQREYYKAVILSDEEQPTKADTINHIKELIDSSSMPEDQKKSLKAMWSSKKHNLTDAATYISLDRRKETLVGLGRWTPEHDAALERVKAQKETVQDLELLNPPFKPEKPFVFTHRIVEGMVVPTQIKNAETVLTPSFALKKDAQGNYLRPKLAAMYQDMEAGKYDLAIFESAVKVGAVGNTLNKKGKPVFSSFEKQEDGSFSLPENAEILNLKTEDWRLQQETPPHYVDERGNFGTQLRNLILADIELDGEYTIGGKKMKGSEVAQLYQSIIVEDLRTSFEDVREMFENEDGSINYDRLSAELRKEVLDREMGQEYLDALAPIEVVLKNGEKATRTALPLYHPMIAYKMEAVMNSFFKNRVTKQKINGGALIDTTSFDVTEELKMKVDPKTGAIIYEALLPAWSKKFFPMNSKGEVDLETVRKTAPELLRIIGYRIPTEDKYSMFNIEVVGFTPISMGGTVILPIEATTVAGLDFDIDKLYFMARAFEVDKKGNARSIKYYERANTKEEADEIAKNIYRNLRDYTRFVKANVKDKAAQERMMKGRQALSDELLEAYAKRTDYKQTPEFIELRDTIKDLRNQLEAAKKMNTDPVFIKFIEDSILEAQKTMEEDFLPFNEEIVAITEKEQPVIEYISNVVSTKGFDPVSSNSKAARDNKKLDIIQGILENKSSAEAILNPGNFDSLKEIAARIRLLKVGKVKEANKLKGEELVEAANALDDEDFNINYPSTQLELFRRNMTGKQLIGSFANHNTHHAKAQFTNLQLKQPIKFNNEDFYMLNLVRNSKGQRISKLLATGLAAVVDNAKDPIASFLNLNTFTVNTIALMQRAGVDEETIFAFMNQPVILELTQKYFNERGSLAEEKHFAAIRAKWQQTLNAKLKEEGIDPQALAEVPLTTALLEKHLEGDKSTEYYSVQLAVLNAFDNYAKMAQELALNIQASKVDTTGVGPTSATNYTLLQKQKRILDKVAKGKNLIVNGEEIFWGGAQQNMIPGFTRYGLLGPINILNKIFPSIGKIALTKNEQDQTEGQIFSFSVLGNLKNHFADQKLNGVLTEKEAHLVNTHFIDFIASAFPFFNYSQSKDILTKLPDRLREFKEKVSPDAPYKLFLDKLYVVDANNYSPIRRIEFYNTGKTPIDNQRAKSAWERMLEDSNPEVKQLALDLVKYTYFANGYGFGPFSFANMVPVKFWTNEFQIANNIVDKQGNPFNTFLEYALDSDKLTKNESTWKKRFIDQFIRNNFEREGFVPSIKIDVTLTPDKEGTTADQINNAVTEAAKASKGGVIRTSRGNLIINRSKNKHLILEATNEPIQYLKVYGQKGKVLLFEHVKTKFDQKNSRDFEERTGLDTLMYRPVGTLGTSNFALEYDYLGDITESVLTNIKNTPNPKVAAPTPGSQLADQLAAEEAAMRAAVEGTQSLSGLSTTVEPKVTNTNPIAGLGGLDVEATMKEGQEQPKIAAESSKTNANSISGFKVGDRVMHKIRGIGTVVSFNNIGTVNEQVTIKLDTGNEYTVVSRFIDESLIIKQSNKQQIETEIKKPAAQTLGPETKINIYASTGENAELSNFAQRPFTDDGIYDVGYAYKNTTGKNITWNTVEAAFQAEKLTYASDKYWTEKITKLSKEGIALIEKLAQAKGTEAKKIGQTIEGLNTKEWDEVSSDAMGTLIYTSFKQNPDALAKLLATGNATLTHTQDQGKWGTEFPKLLMEVRDELRKTQPISKEKSEVPPGIAALDVEATERGGLFEEINWKDYQEVMTKLPEAKRMSKGEFLSLTEEAQKAAIEQAKNC